MRHGLSMEDARIAEGGGSSATEDELRSLMKAPLMVAYLLRGVETTGKKPVLRETSYRDGLILPALGLHFPGSKDADAPRNLVHYRLNRVAQEELLPPDLDDEEAGDDVDTDD